MDENKDFSVDEKNTNSYSDTYTEENTDNTFSGAFSDELAETQGDNTAEDVNFNQNSADVTVAVKTKKRFIQVPIIISIALVVLVALGFLVFKLFFDTSIVGTWTVKDNATSDEAATATSDEAAKTYFTFDSDGKATAQIGTMRMEGTYSTSSDEDGKRNVEISIPSVLEGSYEFTVSGNAFSGRTLLLNGTYYGQSVALTMESAKLDVPKLEPDKDFKPNDKLTGKWTYDDGYYQMGYEFRNDGTVTVNQSNILFADGVYSFTDSQITIKYYTNKEAKMELDYTLKDDSIIIDGMQFKKDTGSTNDQSDK